VRGNRFILDQRLGGFTFPWHLLICPPTIRVVDISTDLKQETKDMDEITFQRKMQELMSRIQAMPESTDEPSECVKEIGERRSRIKASVAELQESLDYLRLSVKYLVFDLEATRRENTYLRRMLEQSSRDAQRQIEDEEPNEDFGDEERFD
jgi:septal ring factor EnvC (AmiA/AmiB activator)